MHDRHSGVDTFTRNCIYLAIVFVKNNLICIYIFRAALFLRTQLISARHCSCLVYIQKLPPGNWQMRNSFFHFRKIPCVQVIKRVKLSGRFVLIRLTLLNATKSTQKNKPGYFFNGQKSHKTHSIFTIYSILSEYFHLNIYQRTVLGGL